MSKQAEKLLSEVLKLPAVDRARVAAELLASVDDDREPGAEAAWAEEIDRRVQRIDADGPKGEDWQQVHARIASRLRSR